MVAQTIPIALDHGGGNGSHQSECALGACICALDECDGRVHRGVATRPAHPSGINPLFAMENPVLEYTILKPEGILVLQPSKSLSKGDFAGLSAFVDTYLADHASIHGVLIHAEAFPGWENFAGFTAHIRFVRNHHQKIERVALVTDSPVARVAEALAKHFIAAEIKHLPFADYEKALSWLKTS